ncbi:MurR/RpiR family transcriptional regulator [Pseudomonas sp. JM0905a]|uniref:MurR/RpiR family transcriptional regulator n=1 Tax=Pseudomonas sp. JM0905a TaxID=2772484 RepID=UPI00168412E0|nr:MurR/RpiR family transcriptional regulator [Pseudomonas sp. JM0905a]MBD2837814.1 MurR/RpiR family transcriptional regulator [Pseudomonas sp. JM0905a]
MSTATGTAQSIAIGDYRCRTDTGGTVDTAGIKRQIQAASASLTPSERKLVRLLTGNSPVVALESVHQIAERANVSAPTVVRFAVKLGYGGFAEFQRAWLVELESMLESPLTLMNQAGSRAESNFGTELGEMVERSIEEMRDLGAAVDLLADQRRRIYLRGGRFSQPLAEYLYAHLREIRGNVEILGRNWVHDLDASLDMEKRDVAVLFDFRRYQNDTIKLAKHIQQQGVTIILFTDRWLSPIAEQARHVLTSDIASSSAYDSLVPAMAQVELLAKRLVERLESSTADRLRRLENIRASATPAEALRET